MNERSFLKRILDKHPTLWEIFKFILIGGIATIIDFLVMGLVLYVWSPISYSYDFIRVFIGNATPLVIATVVATGLGFAVSLIFNYIFSIIFVFNGNGNSTKKAKTGKGFLIFTVIAAIGLLINVLGMWLFYGVIDYKQEWIIKIGLTIVVLIYNYIVRKKVLFKKIDN